MGSTDNAYSNQSQNIINALFAQTDPARQAIIKRGTNFLTGSPAFDVTQSPVWAPAKLGAERNYEQSRQNILANLPRGGVLEDALARNAMGKADTMTNMAGTIGQDEYNKIYGLATGTVPQAISGLTSLANVQAGANAQQNSAKTGALGDIGLGAGMILASKT